MASSNEKTTDRPFLVIDRWGIRWATIAVAASKPLLEQTLDAAMAIPDRWGVVVAVVGGKRLAELERRMPALWSGRGLAAWLWLGMQVILEKGDWSTALARRLGIAAQEAATDSEELAVVLGDLRLERALIGDDERPALVRRRVHGQRVALLTRPNLDPEQAPAWPDDAVRQREAAILASEGDDGVDRRVLGVQALLRLADGAHSGWVILPSNGSQGASGRAAMAGIDVAVGEPLAGDEMFCRAKLAFGWMLVPNRDNSQILDVIAPARFARGSSMTPGFSMIATRSFQSMQD